MAQDAAIQSQVELGEAAGTANRRHQMFPVLSSQEIERIRRFGQVLHYRRGDRLFAAGQPGAGMFVALKGAVAGPLAGRRARVRGLKTTSGFRPAFRVRRWPGAPSCRRKSLASRC